MKLLGKMLPLTLASVVATVYGAPDDQTVSGQATVSTHVGGAMSFDEVMAVAHEIQQKAVSDYQHVLHLQAIARKEKDVIKLNCVNDKLVQIKPHMNLADAAEAEMTSPADATRMTAFDNIVEVAANVRRLREEADQCIGEAVTAGDAQSSNSFTGPHAPDDPTKGGLHGIGGGNDVEAPGYASPFN